MPAEAFAGRLTVVDIRKRARREDRIGGSNVANPYPWSTGVCGRAKDKTCYATGLPYHTVLVHSLLRNHRTIS
jgi:hypothetical protein